MQGGRRLQAAETLDAIRARVARELARLPAALRALDGAPAYPVTVAPALRALADEVDRRTPTG
jgi:nicotinate phosphoribosyltransferase